MPTYEYQCTACGHELEEFHSILEPPLTRCPKCDTDNLVRMMGTGGGLIFKGSGFYQTDYKKEGRSPGKDGASGKGDGTGTERKGEEAATDRKGEGTGTAGKGEETGTAGKGEGTGTGGKGEGTEGDRKGKGSRADKRGEAAGTDRKKEGTGGDTSTGPSPQS